MWCSALQSNDAHLQKSADVFGHYPKPACFDGTMSAKLIVFAWLLSMGTSAQTLPKFMGREVTIIKPEIQDDFFPKGPASVCIAGPPQRQCYTAPKDFGRDPEITMVRLDNATPAIFFWVASGGVSAFGIHFALLRPGTDKELDDSFPYIEVSNQSQHAFWNEPSISASPIFLTADGAGQSEHTHYGEHRYIISAYIRTSPPYNEFNDDIYLLEDQYLTIRKYAPFPNADILASEKQEILARLRRVKAATQSQQ
jgi:hypothetical protein